MSKVRIALLLLFSITFVLAIPYATSAEETCCLCTMSSDTSSGSTCFKIDSTKLKEPNNCKTFASETGIDNQWTCTRKLGANECQPILSGGACALGPQTVVPEAKGEAVQSSSGGATASADTSGILMDFNTDIPGFKNPEDQSLLLGAYVAAIYRYSLSIVTILATVMFIWGAFLYLVGSSTGKISKGKEIMTDAIIGMILLFSANLILRTLNPALVTFGTLDLTQLQYEDIQPTGYIETVKMIENVPTAIKIPINTWSKGNDCLLENFGKSDQDIGSRMVNLTFLGYTMKFHQLAAPDFQSAFKEIESAPADSPVGLWVTKMKRMSPYEAGCGKGKGYTDIGSRFAGSYVPRFDKKFALSSVTKPPCLSCDMHAFGLAVDIDSCFNPMCPKGSTCALTNPKYNRMPKEIVAVFAKYHIYWGGYGWNSAGTNWSLPLKGRDAMHFEWHGRCWSF